MGQAYFPLFWQDLAKNAFPSATGLFTAGHKEVKQVIEILIVLFPTSDAVTPTVTSALTLQRSISTASDGDGDAATAANDNHDAEQVTASL